MHFPEDFVEEVRSRNDIVSVISSVVALKKKGGRYFGVCPFHNEKTPSFSVSGENQLYYCFGCGAGGNVVTFVMQYENFSFQEAITYLAERAGMEVPEDTASAAAKKEEDKRKQLLAVYRDAAAFYYYQLRSPVGKAALSYFERRGLTEETIKKFGLGYAPRSGSPLYAYLKKKGYSDELLDQSKLLKIDSRGAWDRFFNRAMFPIMDIHKRVIAFGGRVMGEGEPKYLNSPESDIFDKSRNLYALYLAKSSRRPYFLLCEGYMDVISLHQAGFDCAVASLGTSFTSGHASLLKRYNKDVIITYDSDAAGVRAALRAIPILKEAGIPVKVLDMSPHKDPDEFINALGAEEYQKRIDNAVNAFFFECDVAWKAVDKRDPEQVSGFQKDLAAKIASFEDALTRDNYIDACSRRYFVKKQALAERVNFIGGRKMPEQDLLSEERRLSANRKKQQKDKKSESYLITWLSRTKLPFETIDRYLKPEYFENELYGRVAADILRGKDEHDPVSLSRLIDTYSAENEEYGKQLSRLFMAEIDEDDKIAAENLRMIKRDYLNSLLNNNPGPQELQRLIKERAELDKEEICLRP